MNKTDYGNWVPATMFKVLIPICIAVLVADIVMYELIHSMALTIILGIILVICLAFTIYMCRCYQIFSFDQGGLMEEMHEFLTEHLAWDGEGTLLDIGCGAGALSIRCAKKFQSANVVGIDYWGKEWNYAKEQCEENARIEGVSNRTRFDKGDAAKLDFTDGAFDAAVSNFVFHEVRTAKDKRDVVREALRVVKDGGAFAFQDLFGQSKLYGDMDDFIKLLESEGIREIHYIPDVDKMDFVPGFVRAPWMIYEVGLIYGIK